MEKGRWMCPTCKWAIEVISDDRVSFSNSMVKSNRNRIFPAHDGCEFWKKFTDVDFTKLTKLP